MEVLDLWRRLLRTDEISVDDDFYDKGGDSLLAADMLLEVERLAGISLEGFGPAVLTIRSVADAVVDGLPQGQAMVTPVKQGFGIPLFFCHGDHAARGLYAHQLMALLPQRRSVFLLNCPQDDARSDIEAVAAGYLPDVLRACGGSPVFVGGFCTAGLVAWQLAHLLRERGVEVAGILLVETPSLNGGRGMRALAKSLKLLGELLPGRARTFVRNEAMRRLWVLKRKGVHGFAAALAKRLRRTDNVVQLVQPGAHARNAELLLHYYQRMASFVPPRIDAPLTCLVADDGTHFDTDPSRWREWVAEMRALRIPGSHDSCVIKHRAALAELLEQVMTAGAR